MSIYTFCRQIVRMVLYPLFRVKVIGKEHFPDQGPVIVCANHTSNFDPPVVGMTIDRPVSFMAKGELFDKPILGKFLVKIQSFPVRRGLNDRNALRNGLEILKEGNVLGLFPEGTRSKNGKIGKALAGAGFFALRSKATVIPCAIIGPYKPFKRVTVIYGKPLDMDKMREDKLSAQEAADAIMAEIEKMQKKAIS